jgi:ATP/maltotriose-dependent transcriptional regulator MalT
MTANGDVDHAADAVLTRADVEREAGNPSAALRILDEGLPQVPGQEESAVLLAGAALRTRLAAAEHRIAEARQQLARLEPGARASTSVRLRVDYLAAKAELAIAEGRLEDARREIEEAIGLARKAELVLLELGLRLDRARIDSLSGDALTAAADATRIEREAARLGLAGLAARAHALARGPALKG